MSRQIHIPNFKSISQKTAEKSPEKWSLEKGNNSRKVGQAWRNSNLICIMSTQIHIPNFKSISQRMTEKSAENRVDGHWVDWEKGNNSCKSRWSVTKLELDLYYVRISSYTKFQVNISMHDWEKSWKPSGRTLSGRTDRQTDGRTDRLTDRRRQNL